MNANIDSQSSFSKLRITDPKAAIVCTEYLLNLKPHESQHQFSQLFLSDDDKWHVK